MNPRWEFAPAIIMAAGATVLAGLGQQQAMPLRQPLTVVVPMRIGAYTGRDVTVPEAELKVVGVTAHLMRAYAADPAPSPNAGYSVYVGYYDRQDRGRTIHSPKNCLPGAGWEAVSASRLTVETAGGPVALNRYLLQNKTRRALVLYWYQGRGRVEADEYRVKWQLLRDAALRQRSEEALVRVVIPLQGLSEEEAADLATRTATVLIPALNDALPTLNLL